jgi:hypothetical protein
MWRKNMRRRQVYIYLAAAVVSLALAGCGKKADKNSGKTVKEETTQQEGSKQQEEKQESEEQTKEEKEENEEKEEAEKNAPKDENGVRVATDNSVFSSSFTEEAQAKSEPYTDRITMCKGGKVGFNSNLRGWDITDESTGDKVILTNKLGATATLSDSKIKAGDTEAIEDFLKEYKKEHFTMEFFKGEGNEETPGDGFDGITYAGAKKNGKKKEIAFLVPVTGDHYLMVSVEDQGEQKLTTMDVFETLVLGMHDLTIIGE